MTPTMTSPTLTRLRRNYKEISSRVVELINDARKEIQYAAPISTESWLYLWNKFIDASDPMVMKMKKDLIPLFTAQGKEVIANMNKHPLPETKEKAGTDDIVDQWMFDKKVWVKKFAETEFPHIATGTLAGGTATLTVLDVGIDFDMESPDVVDFIRHKPFASSLEVNQTSDAALRDSLTAGIKNGESMAEIEKRVVKITKFNNATRAERIAQTEIIGATNKGSLEGSKQSGVVWGNQWLAALDDRVRESHENLTLSGEAVKLGDKFSIGLEYPGDSAGTAAEVVNCRCSLVPLLSKPN